MSWRPSVRAAWAAFWPSRLIVFGVGIWVTISGFIPNVIGESPSLSHPFAAWPGHNLLDLVFSPLAKWDAQHYLAIAYDGYAQNFEGLPPVENRPAFFPLYPGLVHLLSGLGASRGLILLVAYAISLACFFAALTLLHRLTTIEVGERFAGPTLLLLAFFPTALFFGIPYSESLFLLLAVAAFLAARTGHWAEAGIVIALASATRVPGLLLVVPVALLYLYGPRADREPDREGGGWRPRYRLRPNLAWLALAPLGLITFSAYLHFTLDDWFAWNHAQAVFDRHTVDPLSGIWAGFREAGRGIGHFATSSYQGTFDYLNVMQLFFTMFAVVGGIAMLRTLPVAYGAWVLVSLVPIFTSQKPDIPYWSSARFVVVLFPLFIWLATVSEKRGWTTRLVALFAAGMAVFTAQFVLWSFVA
ncbi:MAG TPA: mannosyltransferase family protein [Solirubrobacterales bacterium]|nr:mannosyltransferase family protein [Solirubrobacterales bacterium]